MRQAEASIRGLARILCGHRNPGFPGVYARKCMAEPIGSPMGMIEILRILTPAEVEAFEPSERHIADLVFEESSAALDIDKAWDGIGFLLSHCGGAASVDIKDAVYGGDPVGDDLGYGPARLISPPHVKQLAEALAVIDVATLTQAFDADAMSREEVYPNIWDDDEDALAYLLEYWPLLIEHYQRAANQDAAMLLALT